MWKLRLVGTNYQVEKVDGVWLSTFQTFRGLIPIKWDMKYNTPQKIREGVYNTWGMDLDISEVQTMIKKRDWFEVGDKVRLKANCEDEDLKVWDDLACNDGGVQHIHEVREVYADGRYHIWLRGYKAMVSASDIELIEGV